MVDYREIIRLHCLKLATQVLLTVSVAHVTQI